MEKLKKSLTNELTSKNAKENPQVLITVVQILLGFIIGAIGSLGGIAESLTSNSWLVGIAALLCVLLPLSTKIQILCSSDFLRKISFYLFSLSVGVVLAFISQYLGGFFFGIWMYLGTALLLFYEYNGISQCELKKSFKFVVFGLVIISTGIELVVICDWNIMYFICVVRNI